MTDRTDRDRHQRRRIVVWGCAIHRTPPGEACQGCKDQTELFTRTEVANTTRGPGWRRPRGDAAETIDGEVVHDTSNQPAIEMQR